MRNLSEKADNASFLRTFQRELDSRGTFLGNRHATAVGAVLGDLAPDPSQTRPDSLPTMVTPRELRLLHNFFATNPPSDPVIEIGPYLGGSTAAIGAGLCAAGFGSEFHVADAFHWPDPGFRSILMADFETVGGQKRFGGKVREQVEQGDWEALFSALHKDRPYTPFLKAHRWRLPSSKTDDRTVPFLRNNEPVGAVFIDAFKRWSTTYYSMSGIAPHLLPGTFIIFQDFSWIDCYWLPILISLLGEKILLVAKVDNTAVFRVVSPDFQPALEAFGASPNDAMFATYSAMLNNWSLAQFHSGDDVGFLCHSAQQYVLCHVMGKASEAAEHLVFLKELCNRLNATWISDMLVSGNFEIAAA